jgi:hypothetical protein
MMSVTSLRLGADNLPRDAESSPCTGDSAGIC